MTNAYPITYNASHQLRKIDDLTDLSGERKLTFLFIGKSKRINNSFASSFKSGFYLESLENAIQEIEAVKGDFRFDVIFLDIDLHEGNLRKFNYFLKELKLCQDTIIIYNSEKLDVNKARYLKKKELVDDVLNLGIAGVNYEAKVAFLKRMKIRQNVIVSKDIKGYNSYSHVKTGKNSISKRVIDILVSSLLLICLSPVFIVIGLIIKLESKGPVFYTSHRAGRGFKVFRFYKFRTMVVDADKKISELIHLNQYSTDKGINFLKICNDPRVTPFGKFLRNTSLDELPQLLNVLLGDMSLVGNRPLPLYEASTLTTNDAVERFMAPAGITGLWQIKKRGKENMSAEERIGLDIVYARKHSLSFDLWIMVSTPAVLFQKTNV